MTTREDSLNVLLSATAEVVDDFADEMSALRQEVVQLREAMESRALRLLLRWSGTHKVEPRALAMILVNLGIDEGHLANDHQAPAGRDRAVDAPNLGRGHTSGV